MEDAHLAEYVDGLLNKFAVAPTRGLAETKMLIRTAFTRRLDEQLDLERDKMRELGYSNDYKEGVSAFMTKSKPHFTGK